MSILEDIEWMAKEERDHFSYLTPKYLSLWQWIKLMFAIKSILVATQHGIVEVRRKKRRVK